MKIKLTYEEVISFLKENGFVFQECDEYEDECFVTDTMKCGYTKHEIWTKGDIEVNVPYFAETKEFRRPVFALLAPELETCSDAYSIEELAKVIKNLERENDGLDLQDFIEKYHPNYEGDDRIALMLDLERILTDEAEEEKMERFSDWSTKEMMDEYVRLQNIIFQESFENYTVVQNG
jgi:hypothetical protein